MAPLSFAERLRQVGLDFEAEVNQAVEVAVRSERSEAQLLQEEVEWLQSQLHAERLQSDARLSAVTELKQQLYDVEERHQRQREAAEYWQAEFNVKEEQYSLLEAKLAAMVLSEAEAAESSKEAAPVAGADWCSDDWKLLESPEMCGSTDVGSAEAPESLTEETLQRYLDLLTQDANCQLNLDLEGFHRLLLAAIQQGSRVGVLLNRIVRCWACCLLNRQEGLAVKTAVATGNLEALEALVSLGGTSAADQEASDDLFCSCAAKGDKASLSVLLDHLHDQRTLESIRKARVAASTNGHSDVAQLLATHLVVELSYLGNTKYRAGEYDSAISCYQEAIDLCQEHGGASAGVTGAACHRDNLVRLRYNLARAFHRSDRWMEAREQATAVLLLDRHYLNAYALRAQAAMSALDWSCAKDDWTTLLEQGSASAMSQEVLRAWRRRQDECCRQLAQDHYEVLGLPRLSSPEEVRKAYRELAKRWHPDKHQSRSADLRDRALKRFQRIRQAYEVLAHEASKQGYDTQLLLEQARPLTSVRGFGCSLDSQLFEHWADHEQVL